MARIMRQMDRSRRAMNPQYFNENGTIKRLKRKNGHKQIRHWNYSKNYYRLLHRLRDLNRKLAAVRKTEHYILANELLTYGNEFVVEDMNYKALQKRSKKTKINPKTGRAHTKKRFGKSIGRCAPALFITILGQKASRYGGSVIKVIVIQRKNCPSVLQNFPTEPLFSEICIPHSFYYILERIFNPITKKTLRKISRSLRNCTMKQKSACKTATSGCLLA